MHEFLSTYGYFAIAGVLLMSGIGIPMPEDLPLITGGWLCGRGDADIYIMLPLCLFCVVGADSLLFMFGQRLGHYVPKLPILRSHLRPSRVKRAEAFMDRYGGWALFFARFLPGLRAPIFFTAGHCKVPYWRFLLFDGSAALISVPTIILIARHFWNHLEQVKHWTTQAQMALGVALLLGIGLFFLIKRFRAKPPVPKKIPLASTKISSPTSATP